MAFLNSFALWGSLAALGVAVPIVIHLLSRFRIRRTDWAAMELLRRALIERKRQVRIEDLILLALRCLAMALAALALARPALTPAGAQLLGGSGGRSGVLIALDSSYSMGYKPGLNSRFDLALERIREICSTLERGNPVSLVLMGDRPRIELRNVGYDVERLEKVLRTIKPLPEALNLEPCLAQAQDLFAEIKAPTRECYVITDGQAMTWAAVSEGAAGTLEEMKKLGQVFFVPVGEGGAENMAVTRLEAASGILRRGSIVRYVVDIQNAGELPQSKVNVQLFVGDTPVDQRVAPSLPPGKTATVTLYGRFDDAGVEEVSARLDPDALPLDNIRYAVADIREETKILCVDGEPSDEPFKSETDFLVPALTPSTGDEEGSGLKVVTVTEPEFAGQRLSDYGVVILANVSDVGDHQVRALRSFVRDGGGLIVFLGDKTNLALFNSRMVYAEDTDGAEPLLPAELDQAVGDVSGASEGWMMSSQLSEHPIAQVLASMPPEQRSTVNFRRYFKAKPVDGAQTVLSLAKNGDPILIEKPYGRGKVLLFTTTADRDWTDMVVHPAYLMVLQQAVTYQTRRGYEMPITVSEPLIVGLPSQGALDAVPVRNPKGEELTVKVTERNGQMSASLAHADLAGIYQVQYAAGLAPVKVAVNVEPTESSIRPLRKQELRTTVAKLPVSLVEVDRDILDVIRESRVGFELWRVLLLLALAVLVVEGFLARWFSRRIAAAESVLVAPAGLTARASTSG